jgi:hypothetical protein
MTAYISCVTSNLDIYIYIYIYIYMDPVTHPHFGVFIYAQGEFDPDSDDR